MSKYILELKDDVQVVQKVGVTENGNAFVMNFYKDQLEELNSDYINEHFGDLQDTAYQKGFEDGKAVNDKGCEGCECETHKDGTCTMCSNNYMNLWTAKDDKIEVGDIVERYLNDKLDSTGIYLGDADEKGDYLNCLFWTGACYITLGYPKYQFKKTGRHFDIASILEAMKHD